MVFEHDARVLRSQTGIHRQLSGAHGAKWLDGNRTPNGSQTWVYNSWSGAQYLLCRLFLDCGPSFDQIAAYKFLPNE